MQGINHTTPQTPHDSLVSRYGVTIFNWIVWAAIAQVVVVFGITSNIINMVCFVNQGFKDSINVSLTGKTWNCAVVMRIW